jgi:hypothetical protein
MEEHESAVSSTISLQSQPEDPHSALSRLSTDLRRSAGMTHEAANAVIPVRSRCARRGEIAVAWRAGREMTLVVIAVEVAVTFVSESQRLGFSWA